MSQVLLHKSNKINLSVFVTDAENAAPVHVYNIYTTFHLFPDEAWFHLYGHVSLQNNPYWSSVNPHLIYELPLHDVNVDVYCTMNLNKLLATYFM
jgi:hypothetical protein